MLNVVVSIPYQYKLLHDIFMLNVVVSIPYQYKLLHDIFTYGMLNVVVSLIG